MAVGDYDNIHDTDIERFFSLAYQQHVNRACHCAMAVFLNVMLVGIADIYGGFIQDIIHYLGVRAELKGESPMRMANNKANAERAITDVETLAGTLVTTIPRAFLVVSTVASSILGVLQASRGVTYWVPTGTTMGAYVGLNTAMFGLSSLLYSGYLTGLVDDFLDWLGGTQQCVTVLVGLENAGKSTLCHHICRGGPDPAIERHPFPPSTPLGWGRVPFAQQNIVDTNCMRGLEFRWYDLSGRDRDAWADFTAKAEAIVFLFDAADCWANPRRLTEVRNELRKTLERAEAACKEGDRRCTVLVLGNKIDRCQSIQPEGPEMTAEFYCGVFCSLLQLEKPDGETRLAGWDDVTWEFVRVVLIGSNDEASPWFGFPPEVLLLITRGVGRRHRPRRYQNLTISELHVCAALKSSQGLGVAMDWMVGSVQAHREERSPRRWRAGWRRTVRAGQ